MIDTAYADSAALLAASSSLAAHLNTLTGEQISAIYANGYTIAADGNLWSPAPEHWLEADPEGRYFVDQTGAAAKYNGMTWGAIDPGSDILNDQGLAVWGSEGFGYPTDNGRHEFEFTASGICHVCGYTAEHEVHIGGLTPTS